MKYFRFLLVVTMAFGLLLAPVGCQTVKDWFCPNAATIENVIAGARTTIATIESEFPGIIPIEYQAAINAAGAVIAQGTAMLDAKYCPTAADVQAVQTTQTTMNKSLRMAGTATLKALRKP